MRSGLPAQFYSTAQFTRLEVRTCEVVRVPASTVHAKQIGTRFTVCGLLCDNWFKFWTQPFYTVVHQRCRDCESALIAANSEEGRAGRPSNR